MIEIAIMIEGQNGLNWGNWQNLSKLVDSLGFAGLHRSDHFTNAQPPDLDSLELWTSLTWLADNTKNIDFGPLVSPVSFRHPVLTARIASAVDDLSNGRLRLGLGAGWQIREHQNFGFDLLELGERFKRFEEALIIITHLLRNEEPLSFRGEYYKLQDTILLPKPKRKNGPPIIIGGNGPKFTLPLVTQFADEWNAVYMPPAKFKEMNIVLNEMLEEFKRSPESVKRTVMTGTAFGKTDDIVNSKLRGRSKEDLRSMGVIVGTPSEIKDQIAEYERAGAERIVLQWLDLNDLDNLTLLGETLL